MYREKYKVLIDLIVLFIIVFVVTLIIKNYFRPLFVVAIIFFIASPVLKILIRLKINKKFAAALSILFINIVLFLFIFYLGASVYGFFIKIYKGNAQIINDIIKNFNTTGKSAFEYINTQGITANALQTGDVIVSYFIGNICSFFLLIDSKKVSDLIKIIIPKDIITEIIDKKTILKKMAVVEINLVLFSTLQIIIGFIIFRVKNPITLGLLCGLCDILPYIGTIIVFIPIIIYNVIVKQYFLAIGLVLLYILVTITREILEAKFLSNKLELHPLLVVLSVYVGIKLFGFLGIIVGPVYSILAKDMLFKSKETF